jgi:hypothetical protein
MGFRIGDQLGGGYHGDGVTRSQALDQLGLLLGLVINARKPGTKQRRIANIRELLLRPSKWGRAPPWLQ